MHNHDTTLRRLLNLPMLLVAIAAVLATGLLTSSASATGAPSVNTAVATSARSGAEVITCKPQVQNPHNSTHKPENVNVVVTITCNHKVAEILIRAALYRNGNRVKESPVKTVRGKASAQTNAAVPCKNGTYRGWGFFEVVFPPHFTPPTRTTSGFGRSVSIKC